MMKGTSVAAHMRAVRAGAQIPVAGRTRAHARRRRCRRRGHSPTTTTTSRSSLRRRLHLRRSCLLSPRSAAKRASRPARRHQRRRRRRGARNHLPPHRSRPASRLPWRHSSRTLPPLHHPPQSSSRVSRAISVCTPLASSASLLDFRALVSAGLETESGTWGPFWRIGGMLSVAVSKRFCSQLSVC